MDCKRFFICVYAYLACICRVFGRNNKHHEFEKYKFLRCKFFIIIKCGDFFSPQRTVCVCLCVCMCVCVLGIFSLPKHAENNSSKKKYTTRLCQLKRNQEGDFIIIMKKESARMHTHIKLHINNKIQNVLLVHHTVHSCRIGHAPLN